MTDKVTRHLARQLQDGRFTLPGHDTTKSLKDLWRWQRNGKRTAWPDWVENRPHAAPARRVEGDNLSVTWIGHATALIQTQGLNILTDPFFSLRASPFRFAGPKRVRGPGIALDELPPIDLVLLSHNHYDHMDTETLQRLSHDHAMTLVTPHGNARHVRRLKPGTGILELGWHDVHEHARVKISPTPALHWSRRTLFDSNRALWSAFYITTPTHKIYFAADTGFGSGEHFTLTRDMYGEPDLALIPIGAYEPRWFMAPQHIDPEEAVLAHKLLGAKSSIAIHHATIQLTDEGIDDPARELAKARRRHGLAEDEFRVLEVGETWRP
jgi:L-ascorbate metabolism protein UlaG (beta-lactamase superfamily)